MGCLGDSNWIAGDAGTPGLLVLDRSSQCAATISFGGGLVVATPVVLKNTPEAALSPLAFQEIQTPAGNDSPYPQGDVMMLVNLPLQAPDKTGALANVPGPLGQFHTGSVLIRTFTFASSADINHSQASGWRLEDVDDFPYGGMLGFWVSGGHFDPVFYAYVNDPVSGVILYRRTTSPGWNRLNVSGVLTGGVRGPAFVNPYDTYNLYVLTVRGVEISSDGGQTFSVDSELTNLVTRGGQYPMRNSFSGFNGTNVIGDYAISPMGNISAIAFSRQDPAQIVVATPYAGLFYRNAHHQWIDCTHYLPTPRSPLSSVAIFGDTLYVATEGRGLLAIGNYQSAVSAPRRWLRRPSF
jgi:hypothetical protein